MKTARWLVTGFGVLAAVLGVSFVFAPQSLIDFADVFLSDRGLWIAVALRLTLGLTLWIAAAASRTPATFRVLGGLFVLSGLALPLLGLRRLRGIVEWGSGLPPIALVGMGLVAALLGAFFVWSASPRRSET